MNQHLQFWLGEILRSDHGLACEWLSALLGAAEPPSYISNVGPVAAAVSVLGREQRIGILEKFGTGPFPVGLARLLVARDPGIYAKLLSIRELAEQHLEPLYGNVDDGWAELAARAVEAGYSPRVVAEHTRFDPGVAMNIGDTEFWRKRELFFAELEADPDTLEVAREGRRVSTEETKRAEAERRGLELNGFR